MDEWMEEGKLSMEVWRDVGSGWKKSAVRRKKTSTSPSEVREMCHLRKQAESDGPHSSLSEAVTKFGGDTFEVELSAILEDLDEAKQHSNFGVARLVPLVARHDGKK
jgi:hypothetical protein